MKRGFKVVLVLAMISALGVGAACSRKYVTEADFERIDNGMSYSEVKSILGSPLVGSRAETTFLWTTKDKTKGILLNFDSPKGSVSGRIIINSEPMLKEAIDGLSRK